MCEIGSIEPEHEPFNSGVNHYELLDWHDDPLCPGQKYWRVNHYWLTADYILDDPIEIDAYIRYQLFELTPQEQALTGKQRESMLKEFLQNNFDVEAVNYGN